MEEDVVEDYKSSLRDLNCNSKPLINMLTMLAEDNVKQAPKIVQLIESHLAKVSPEVKLPVMYLIDSIIKNVGNTYLQLFTQNIVSVFCSVFEKVDERTRMQLFKLRQTWSEIFPPKKMYGIDVRVNAIDPAWPVQSQTQPMSTIHVNPKFLETKQPVPVRVQSAPMPQKQAPQQVPRRAMSGGVGEHMEDDVHQQLIAKQAELLQLQRQKLELDLLRLKNQAESLQTSKPTPAIKQTPSVPVNDPRLARRDPRTVSSSRIGPQDPRLAVRTSSQPRLPSAVVPVAPPVAVDPTPRERTQTSNRHVTPPAHAEPQTVIKKTGSPKKDLALASKDHNKNIPSVVKVPDQSSPSKDSSQQPKHSDDKSIEKVSPKSKTDNNSSRSSSGSGSSSGGSTLKKDKTAPAAATAEVETPIKGGKDKVDSSPDEKNKKKSSPDDRGKKKSTPEKSTPDGKRKDTKKRSPKSPSKKENRKTRDLSPNKKNVERKGGKKSPEREIVKSKQPAVEVVSAPAEAPKTDQPQDVDLRVLQQQQQQKTIGSKSSEQQQVEKIVVQGKDLTLADEPPPKRPKTDRVDSLFGVEDQDYRMLTSKFSEDEDEEEDGGMAIETMPVNRARQKNWAQYKKVFPDEFKSPLRPAKENIQGPVDKDFRIQNFGGKKAAEQRRHGFDRLGRPLLSRINRRPSLSGWHNEIPLEDQDLMMLSRESEILQEADQQMRAGLIKPHEHQMLIARFGAMRSKFPQDSSWPNSGKESPMNFENGNVPLQNKECPNMMNHLPPNKTILIDDKPRNIQFFDERVVVEMDDKKLYEITFTGPPRMVILDGKELCFLSFGETRDFTLHGRQHKIRFGSPSREVYLDGVPYKATFGGDPFPIMLDGVVHHMKLAGPPPNVELSAKPFQVVECLPPADVDELLDVDMRDAFPARTKSPPPPDSTFTNSVPDEKLEDVDMRVGIPVSQMQPQVMPMEDPVENPPPDPPVNFMPQQQQQQSNAQQQQQGPRQGQPPQGIGPGWEPASWRGQEFNLSPRQDWGSPHRDQPPPDGPDRLAVGPNKDWHPQQEPMDWECKGTDQQRLKFQTFRPDEAQRREAQKNRDWDWSNSPQRYDEFPPMPVSQAGSIPGPGHREPHMQGPHPGHMVGPHHMHNMVGPRQVGPHQNPRPMGTHSANIHPSGMHIAELGPHLGGPPHPGSHLDRPQETAHMGGQHMGPLQGHQGSGVPLLQAPEVNHPMGPRMGQRYLQYGGNGHMRQQTGGGLMRPRYPNMRFNQERPGFVGGPRYRPMERGPYIPIPPKDIGAPVTALPPAPMQPDIPGLAPPPEPSQELQAIEPIAASSMDVTVLLSKLIASGLIGSSTNPTAAKTENAEQEEPTKEIPPIELAPECLKTKHPGVMAALYTGMQCASCGMRFQDCQQDKYSQHLDWHFRSNRREKDGVKKAFSRKWFYDVEDWVQFEELEDLEDRAPSLFEIQADEEQFQTANEPVELPSVVAHEDSADNVCVVCGEPLPLFWVEEAEEWHLRGAVRHDGKTYHPLCYQDFQKAQAAAETPTPTDAMDTNPLDKVDSDGVIVIKTEPEDPPEETAVEETMVEGSDQTGDKDEPGTDENKYDDKKEDEIEKEEDKGEVDMEETPPGEETESTNQEAEPEQEETYQLEEEIIGVINSENEDNGYEDDLEDGEIRPEPEMVVIQSGGITLKVKAGSVAVPSATTAAMSPSNANSNTGAETGKETGKEDFESGELVDTSALDETDTEDEFVPPPPDPRFHVLPPVQRGKELSGLCSIM